MSDDLFDPPPPPAPNRRRATSRRANARCWAWLPSRSIKVKVEGRYPDGSPFTVTRPAIPWQDQAADPRAATIALAERTVAVCKAEAVERSSGLRGREEHLTLNEWVQRAQKSHRLPPWSEADSSTWKRWCKRLGNFDLRQLDNARIDTWLRWMEQREMGAAMRLRSFYLLRRVVSLAIDAQLIAKLPWNGTPGELPARKERGDGRGAHSPDEISEIVRVASERDASERARDRPADLVLRLATSAALGARPSEVARLGPSDVSLDAEGRGWIRAPLHKAGKRHRDKTIVREVSGDLARALLAHHAALCAKAQAVGTLFPRRRPNGSWVSRAWFEEVGARGVWHHELFTEAEVKAIKLAVPSFVPYNIRHTALTALASHASLAVVASRSGHRQGSPSLTTYIDSGRLAAGSQPRAFVESSPIRIASAQLTLLPNAQPSDAIEVVLPSPVSPVLASRNQTAQSIREKRPQKEGEKRERKRLVAKRVAPEPVAPWELSSSFSPAETPPAPPEDHSKPQIVAVSESSHAFSAAVVAPAERGAAVDAAGDLHPTSPYDFTYGKTTMIFAPCNGGNANDFRMADGNRGIRFTSIRSRFSSAATSRTSTALFRTRRSETNCHAQWPASRSTSRSRMARRAATDDSVD